MGWIEVNDTLSVYSITDDLVNMFNWIIEFITTMSPFYFALMFIGVVVIILLGIADKVKSIGKRVVK